MPFLYPDQIFHRTFCISLEYLKQQGITALLLDVDNTLTAHGSQELSDPISQWLSEMKASGIKMAIVSNNTKKRVAPFAKAIGLEFCSFAVKPSPLGLAKACKMLKVNKKTTALVGDQIFTDMFAAKLYGMPCLLVEPIHADTKWTIRLKRTLEKPFIQMYYKHGGQCIK